MGAGLLAAGVASLFASCWIALGGDVPRVSDGREDGWSRLHALALRCATPLRRVATGLARALGSMAAPLRRLGSGHAAERAAELPEMLDIVALGLTAGLSFDAALSEYCTQANGRLARELASAQLSWQMGLTTRGAALEEVGVRLGEPALTRFAASVTEALELGTPLAATLDRQAHLAREEQRALVEERIERAPVKMLIPLGSLVVPAMLLAIVGPLVAAVG
jgi:tight adherence protein C